jgi:hypothetical protein
MLGSSHLTNISAEKMSTAPGMAHYAGSGPAGRFCGDCRFKDYSREVVDKFGQLVKIRRSGGCAKFHALTGTHGPAIRPYLRACRYFEPAEAK